MGFGLLPFNSSQMKPNVKRPCRRGEPPTYPRLNWSEFQNAQVAIVDGDARYQKQRSRETVSLLRNVLRRAGSVLPPIAIAAPQEVQRAGCTVDYVFIHELYYDEWARSVYWNAMLTQWVMSKPASTFKWFCNTLDDLQPDEWFVACVRTKSYGIFKPVAFDTGRQRELERQLFVELVSVPAGRFKGLLVDGGVEYQRQMASLCELKM